MTTQTHARAVDAHDYWCATTKHMLETLGLWGSTREELLELQLVAWDGQPGLDLIPCPLYDEVQVDAIMRWQAQCQMSYAEMYAPATEAPATCRCGRSDDHEHSAAWHAQRQKEDRG